METSRERFLRVTSVADDGTALKNSVVAAFQHNKTYRDNVLPARHERLRRSLETMLQELSLRYVRSPVSDAGHEAHIQHLSDELSATHGGILINSRFRIGTSQKALNLYLKFLWCLGRLHREPIHCPLDRGILMTGFIYEAWTQLDDIQTYRNWIYRLRVVARLQSLSEWELELWNASYPEQT